MLQERWSAMAWGGIDLKATEGTDFASIYSGKVLAIRICKQGDSCFTTGLGSWVVIRSGDFSIRYAPEQEELNIKTAGNN